MSAHELVTWILGTILAGSAVLGLAVKWILMPYIRENIAKPVAETHRQVTVNGHSSDRPTILDGLSDIRAELLDMRRENSENISRVEAKIDSHTAWHLNRR